MKSMSNKNLVPVESDKIKFMLNVIGQRISKDKLRRSFVEIGWNYIGFYSYRMLLAKLSRGGLDFRTILAIVREIPEVTYSDVIIEQPDEWFEK